MTHAPSSASLAINAPFRTWILSEEVLSWEVPFSLPQRQLPPAYPLSLVLNTYMWLAASYNTLMNTLYMYVWFTFKLLLVYEYIIFGTPY